MSSAYAWLSVIGIISFLPAGDTPVAIVFMLLALIYLSELVGRFFNSPTFVTLQNGWQVLNGIWLMYLTFAFPLNIANGVHFWV